MTKTLRHYLQAHPKTHLIFDFDATLFLLDLPWHQWGKTMREGLRAHDPIIWDDWQAGRLNVAQLQNEYIKQHGAEARRLIIEHANYFENALLRGWEPHPQLRETIEQLPAATHTYVWSSNTRAVVEKVLMQEGMDSTFKRLVTRDDVSLIKPDPEGFYLVYDPTVAKSKYLMIGDSNADRDAAAAAGIDFFRIDYF